MLMLTAVVRQIRKGRVESLKVGLLVHVINYVSLSSVPPPPSLPPYPL